MDDDQHKARHALEGAMRPRSVDLDDFCAIDPAFFEAAAKVYGAARRCRVLPQHERALLEMGLDALATQVDQRRLAISMREALAVGATRDQVIAVLEVVSVIGLHTMTVGLPIFFDLVKPADQPWSEEQEAVIADLSSPEPRVHELSPLFAGLLRYDTEYFADFIHLIDHPWRAGVLGPRLLHLVCVLIDCSCSHLYEPGLRLHIEGALESGATPAEIFEVMQLATTTGMRTIEAGFEQLLALDRGDASHPAA